ncbi:MAG: GxxExxY protein [Acidobacteria bacterium 13_1_40CM_65_14]|nr:MAG: GxxExxY protein [Acidobacteria bacterium 13_1_40CM_65_14]OLC84577.1 MAG: GxxExxY protein [Acidobacteria bacterium 13_1_40CM_4_65_8]
MFIDPSTFSHVTRKIIGAAIEVHKTLGPGLLESIYQACLQRELTSRNMRFVVQRPVPIVYKGLKLDAAYRIDLIVEDLVVVEVKSVAALAPIHEAQGLTYLRLTGCPAGLLINFNVPLLVDGVQRLLNPAAGVQNRGRS